MRPATLPAPPPGSPPADAGLRRAVDALHDALWVLGAVRDEHGRIVDFTVLDANSRAAEAAGVTPMAARGRLLGELVGSARRLGHIARFARVVETGEPDVHDFREDPPDGPPVWRRVHAVPFAEGVVLTLADVTARVSGERARAAAEADLRLLAENATDMICRLTPDGRMIYVSPASREILGLDPEDLVGRRDTEFIHPEDRAAVAAHRRRLGRGGRARTVRYRGRPRRGGWVWLEAASRGVHDDDGTLREIHVAVRDVTERARAEAEHAALHRVSEAVATGLADHELHSLVAGEVAHLLDADGGRVVRYLDPGQAEILGAWRRVGMPGGGARRVVTLSPTWAIARVRLTGAPAQARLSAEDAAAAGADLLIGVAAPVRVEGRLWGAVAAAFRTSDRVPPGAVVRLERFAKLVGLAVANAEARARLTAQATTDALTGLANHGAFHAALGDAFARTARYGRPLSLAVIDLDRFKALNDGFGHRAGDRALTRVGALLRAHARQADVVGRVGGEELAWLMPETDLDGAAEAAERLRAAIAAAPAAGPLGLTASIGVACRTPAEMDPESLFRRADAAVYRAKLAGRDRVVASS